MISYNKLWHKLIDAKMNKTQLQQAIGCAPGTMAKLSKDEKVSMEVIIKICNVLNCEANEIMDIVPEGKGE